MWSRGKGGKSRGGALRHVVRTTYKKRPLVNLGRRSISYIVTTVERGYGRLDSRREGRIHDLLSPLFNLNAEVPASVSDRCIPRPRISYLFPRHRRRLPFSPPADPARLVMVPNVSRCSFDNVREGRKKAGVKSLERDAVVSAEAGVEFAQEKLVRGVKIRICTGEKSTLRE